MTHTYTLKVNVHNGTTNPDVVVDVDFNRNGLLRYGHYPLFIADDLGRAGIPASIAKCYVEDAPDEVLQHALTIHDARVSFDADEHPRLVAALEGDLDALDRGVWNRRKREKQNAFLREKGYRWEKRGFYVGGDIGDIVERWFLINPDGEPEVGARPDVWGVAEFGDLERTLTALGFYGPAAAAEQAAADVQRAEERAAWEVVDAADLTWRNSAATAATAIPADVDMFNIDSQTRTNYGLEQGEAIWVRRWEDDYAWNRNMEILRFPWNLLVAGSLSRLRRDASG